MTATVRPASYRTAVDVFACERFAVDVARYAQRRDHSQTAVAHLCGLAQASLHEVFRGERAPSLYQVVQLAKYAHLSLDDYITRPDPR